MSKENLNEEIGFVRPDALREELSAVKVIGNVVVCPVVRCKMPYKVVVHCLIVTYMEVFWEVVLNVLMVEGRSKRRHSCIYLHICNYLQVTHYSNC